MNWGCIESKEREAWDMILRIGDMAEIVPTRIVTVCVCVWVGGGGGGGVYVGTPKPGPTA
jgi:hypothetical protein